MGLFVERDQQIRWRHCGRVQNCHRSARKGLRCAAAILTSSPEHGVLEDALRVGNNSVQRAADAVR